MMNNVLDFTKCSNCGACYNICPVSAISVNSEKMFYSLSVDSEKCVKCGLCKEVCPVNNPEQKQNLVNAYMGYNRDEDVVKNSSSGGAFAAIAEYVLEKGGKVFAAAFSDDFRAVEFKSTDEVSLEKLMRSKYVESYVGNSFQKIKKELTDGQLVLFCGAPCQVAGLKRFLKKEYENLITCDFSCEGMASHKTYIEYLENIENKLKAPVSDVNFRAKLYGWSRHSIKITAENGKEYKNFAMADPYFYSFIGSAINLRDYCLECKFPENHYADIILADFWAYKRLSKVQNDDTGLSLVISNSQKGEEILQAISDKVTFTKLELEKASYNMKNKSNSDEFIKKHDVFIKNCEANGFLNTMKQVKMQSKTKLMLRYYLGNIKSKVR